MSRRSVAVTGVGVVVPGAIGFDAFTELLRNGRSAIATDESLTGRGFRSQSAGRVTGFTPKQFIKPAKLRRLNQLSRFGLAAASLALEQAGIDPSSASSTGVSLGTSFGPVETSVRYLDEYLDKGPSLAPPQLFAESVANAPGSHIAIEWGLRGFNVTFTQREASAATAMGYAAVQLASGNVRRALCGGVEEINDVLYGVLDRVGALARGDRPGLERMRPFDQRRSGLLPGEGGAVIVLDEESSSPLCHVTGFATGRDRSASLIGWGTDHSALSNVMRRAVEDAGLELAQIDVIHASANGSRQGDAIEARAVAELFGGEVPVVATKGYFGEYAGGGGAQLAAAIASISEGVLWKSVGFESGEEAISVVTEPTRLRSNHVLVNAIAAGGGIVSLVLSREPL